MSKKVGSGFELVLAENGVNFAGIMLGNGDGSFKAHVTYIAGGGILDVTVADFNSDGALDIFTAENGGTNFGSVLLNNGDGTFRVRTSYFMSGASKVAAGDFNEDGILDVLSSGHAAVLLGNANGSFKAPVSWTGGTTMGGGDVGDINNDGHLDFMTVGSGSTWVFLGNGDATFKAPVTYTGGTTLNSGTLTDFTGDGYLDFLTVDVSQDTAVVLIGNGDGTFKQRVSFATAAVPVSSAIADFNRDGAMDIVTANQTANAMSIFVANATDVTTIAKLNLNSQSAARVAMNTLQATYDRIVSERGNIGASMSRIQVATKVLGVSRENYINAESRIMDADIASEKVNWVASLIVKNLAIRQ